MKDQYKNFLVKELNVTLGSLDMADTLDEDIADNAGIRQAYLAYGKL